VGRELTPQEASARIEAGEANLVDLRRDDEVAESRIAGATHVPMDRLAERAGELEGPIIFVCHVGERSLMAAQAFEASGREAYSVAGGIAAWGEAGLPVER
jgi:rhodanese-related sulfurtransferase